MAGPTRVVRLWQERWEVPARQGGKGHAQLIARMEKKYVGLKLDEMEQGWNIYMIDEVKFTGSRRKKFTLRAVTNSMIMRKMRITRIIERNTILGKSTR